ncbi:Crp/Fnr family transcriptional regulator [Desertivirga arenae]|uniref:Crp/Fnr family transcriptional regulator n=1 Tax=Desertivirga arenae TaxID=2810309 RepID=UPI001A95CB9E|nr:Crp/Fnr family transcriptional regulator [Pedobacter sp. SYSU D00823]
MAEGSAIIDYIRRFVDINEEEASVFNTAFKKIFIKKRQFIVQPDFPVPNRYYVLQGAFRAYVVTEEGHDHTVSFAIDDWWITDYNAYLYQQKATMFVVALEDSMVLALDFTKEQELKIQNPKFETFFCRIAERGLAYQQRRVISNLTMTAEERYQDFLNRYPLFVQRVPQYALASFLGMSTEYLSRLRNKRVTKTKNNI